MVHHQLKQLENQCNTCRQCPLGQTRQNLVFGVGNPTAPVLFVGEGPGQQEDLQGVPFVGPAGQLLDAYLKVIDLDRTNCYIANIVKCRPHQLLHRQYRKMPTAPQSGS